MMDYDDMYRERPSVESIINTINYILSNKRNRHVVGGIMLSVSFLFGGLALTAMTAGEEEEKNG